jgi:MYXO-CTERM domain-containing protein
VVKLEGPDDPMVELLAGDARIGDTITSRSAELRAIVTGGEGATLRFLRNGMRHGDAIMVDADPFETTLAIDAPAGDADDRWRAQLEVDGDPRVVTSHVWIEATGEPIVQDGGVDGGPGASPAGCGCRAAQGTSAAPMLALLALALVLQRRR